MSCSNSYDCCESGQMAVELAVVLPVVLAVMVIALDCLVFMGECARFDHLAAQQVLAKAVSPASGAYDVGARSSAVKSELAAMFSDHGMQVDVSYADAGVSLSDMCAFTCTLRMPPWPFSSHGSTVLGISIPTALTHSYTLVVDPYTPGAL